MESQYRTFISYSHQDNKSTRLDDSTGCVCWADLIYDFLLEYETPPELVGSESRFGTPVPARPYPVFRDHNEFPTASNLETAITDALDASDTLLVICSPRSARSFYVDQEVRYFKQSGRADRIIAIIIDGEPNAEEKGFPELECFVPSLRYGVTPDGELDETVREEPIAADVRQDSDILELDQENLGHQLAVVELELKRLVAGIMGVALSSLVNWEHVHQGNKAEQLFVEASAEVESSKSVDVYAEPAAVIVRLLAAENTLLEAQSLAPNHAGIRHLLADLRRAIFELALKEADLVLATAYAELLKQQDGSDELWRQLDDAWSLHSPMRNPTIRRSKAIVRMIPVVVVFQLLATAVFGALGAELRFASALVLLFSLGCIPVMLLYVWLAALLDRVQAGVESAFLKIPIATYALAFASLLGAQLTLLVALAFSANHHRLGALRLIWTPTSANPERRPS